MARYTFTLTLGSLTVTLRPPAESFQRSIVQDSQVTLTGFTPNGTPLFSGTAPSVANRRYSWVFSHVVTEQQALIIEAIARAQTPSSLAVLKDEYTYMEPELTTLSKGIVAGSQITVTGSYITGLFQGNVWVELPEQNKILLGSKDCTGSTSSVYNELNFTLLEIP